MLNHQGELQRFSDERVTLTRGVFDSNSCAGGRGRIVTLLCDLAPRGTCSGRLGRIVAAPLYHRAMSVEQRAVWALHGAVAGMIVWTHSRTPSGRLYHSRRGGLSRAGKRLFDIADVVIDTRVPWTDASVPLDGHGDAIGPVSTMAFVTVVWMTITTVAEILSERGVELYIHPSHNVPGDTTARGRLDAALAEYKRRIAGV